MVHVMVTEFRAHEKDLRNVEVYSQFLAVIENFFVCKQIQCTGNCCTSCPKASFRCRKKVHAALPKHATMDGSYSSRRLLVILIID
jgi:hypothetical protein